MPGFTVRDVGKGPSGQPKVYLTYTWRIPRIFTDTITDPGSSEALVYLRDATLPTFTVTKEQVQGASLEYKFAKGITWDDVKVTWYDTVGLLGKMKKWRAMVWTKESGIQPANKYKNDSELRTFLPTDDNSNSWILRNSWPSTIKYGDLTYTQSDVKLVDITVTYDWAEEDAA